MKKGRIEFKGKMQYTGINLKKKLHKETRRIVGGKKVRMQYSPHNKNQMVNSLLPYEITFKFVPRKTAGSIR